MATFEQGDVVLVPFPYTDRSTRQRRPALVVSHGSLDLNANLVWVAMITSADNRPWPDDVPFGQFYAESGLPAPSVVRPIKLATIDGNSAEWLGRAPSELVEQVRSVIVRHLAPTK